jgi:hypothetical protein
MGAKKLERTPAEIMLEQWIKIGVAVPDELSMKALGKPSRSLQSRVDIDAGHVRALGQIVDRGGVLDRVVVFRDPDTKEDHLADGFHRHELHRVKKLDSIRVWLVHRPYREAILFSVSANLRVSKPPTDADKRKAVFMLLEDAEYRFMPSSEIAWRCGVHESTASLYRRSYFEEHGLELPQEVRRVVKGKVQVVKRPKPEESKPIYRVIINGTTGERSAFLKYKDKSIPLGPDTAEAKRRFEAEKSDILDRENVEYSNELFEKDEHFYIYLRRHGVKAEQFKFKGSTYSYAPTVKFQVAYGEEFIAVLSSYVNARTILELVGALFVLRQLVKPSARLIVAATRNVEKWDAVAACGIEFMGLDRLVAEFKAKKAP